jgi:hypothetical protein
VHEGKVIEAPQLMTPEFKRAQARKIQEVLLGNADPSTIGVDRIITRVTSAGPGVSGVSMVGKIVGVGQAGKGYHTAPKTQITGGGLFDTKVTDTGASTEGWFTDESINKFLVTPALTSEQMKGMTAEQIKEIMEPAVDWQDVQKQKSLELLRGSAETLAQTGMLPKTVQFPHRLVEIAEQYKVKPEDIFTSEPGMYRPARAVSPEELSAAYSRAIGGGTMAGYLAAHPEVGGQVDVREVMKDIQKKELLPLYQYQTAGETGLRATRQAMRGIWPELIPLAQQYEADIKRSVTPFKTGGTTPFPTAGGAAAAGEAGYLTWPYPTTITASLPQLRDDIPTPSTGGGTRYIAAAGSGGSISPWLLGAAGGGLLLAGAGKKKDEE